MDALALNRNDSQSLPKTPLNDVEIVAAGNLEFGPKLLRDTKIARPVGYISLKESLSELPDSEAVPLLGQSWVEFSNTRASPNLQRALSNYQTIELANRDLSSVKKDDNAEIFHKPDTELDGNKKPESELTESSAREHTSTFTSNSLQLLANVVKSTLYVSLSDSNNSQIGFSVDSILPYFVHIVPFSSVEYEAQKLVFRHHQAPRTTLEIKGWSRAAAEANDLSGVFALNTDGKVLEPSELVAQTFGPFSATANQQLRLTFPLLNSLRKSLETSRINARYWQNPIQQSNKVFWPFHIVLQTVAPSHISTFKSFAEARQILAQRLKLNEKFESHMCLCDAILNWSACLLNVQVISCTLQETKHGGDFLVKPYESVGVHLSSLAKPNSKWPRKLILKEVYGQSSDITSPTAEEAAKANAQPLMPISPCDSDANQTASKELAFRRFKGLASKTQSIASLPSAVSLSSLAKNSVLPTAIKLPQLSEQYESGDCVICLTNPSQVLVLPCKHYCVCSDCGYLLRSQTIQSKKLLEANPTARVEASRCPVCRSTICNLINILHS